VIQKSSVAIVAVAILTAVEGCAPKRAASDTAEQQSSASMSPACSPITTALDAGANIESMVGDFRVTLVATSGANTGRRVSGPLTLGKSGTAGSLSGTMTVSLDSIGATAPGPRPIDGRYSAVALQWSGTGGARQITLRLGNSTPGAIEGAHMALSVKALSTTRFAGSWTSANGQPMAPEAVGYFCGERVP
jgi:hypothetical protein